MTRTELALRIALAALALLVAWMAGHPGAGATAVRGPEQAGARIPGSLSAPPPRPSWRVLPNPAMEQDRALVRPPSPPPVMTATVPEARGDASGTASVRREHVSVAWARPSASRSIRGVATWLCNPGIFPGVPWSRCTAGHPWYERAVAVPWALRNVYRHGSRVRLSYGGRATVATVVDVNEGTSWDAYATVFDDLAPLGRGVIPITIERVP